MKAQLFFWLKEDPQFLIQNWSLQSLIVVYKGPWGLSQPHFNHRPKIPQEGQIKTCHGGFTYLEISKISDVSSIWLISTQWQWRKTLDCHNSLFGASCYGVDPKKKYGCKKTITACHLSPLKRWDLPQYAIMFVWNGVGWWSFFKWKFTRMNNDLLHIYRQVKAVKKALKVGVNFRQHRKTKDGGTGKGTPIWNFWVISDVYIFYELHDSSRSQSDLAMISLPPPFWFTFVVTLISSWQTHLCWVYCLVTYFEVCFFAWAGKAPGNLTGFFLGLFLVIVCLNNHQYTSFSQWLTFKLLGITY